MKTENNIAGVGQFNKASKTFIDTAKKLVERQKTILELFDQECTNMQDKKTYVMIFRWSHLNDTYSNKSQLENEKIALTKNVHLIDIVRKFFLEIEKVEYYSLNHEKTGLTTMTWWIFFFVVLIWCGLIFLAIWIFGPFTGLAVGMTASSLITVLVLVISDCADKRLYEHKIKTRAKNLKKFADEYNKKFLENIAYNIEVSQYGGVIKLIKNNKFQRSILKLIQGGVMGLNHKLNQKLPEDSKQIDKLHNNKSSSSTSVVINEKESTSSKPKKMATRKIETAIENENGQEDPHNDSGMAMINVQDFGNQNNLVDHMGDDEDFEFSEVREGNHMHAGTFGINQNNQNNSQMVKSYDFECKDYIKNVQIEESYVVNQPKKALLQNSVNIAIEESSVINAPKKTSPEHKTNVTIQESCVVNEQKKDTLEQSSLPNTMRLDSRYVNSSRLDSNN